MEVLERIAGGVRSWLGPSNIADWRQLACSRPGTAATGRRFTVAEFIDGANCTSERRSTTPTGSAQGDHVTHDDVDVTSRRRPSVDLRQHAPKSGAGQKPDVAAAGNVKAERAQSTVKYMPSDVRLSRRLSTSGGSAALVALALCAAMLALLGGLLLCRAKVRRSRGGGKIRRYRKRHDLFVVYADEDESWVTGTLLDVIFGRHPSYDVILQQHLPDACDTHVADLQWNNHEQMVFGSLIDHSTVRSVTWSLGMRLSFSPPACCYYLYFSSIISECSLLHRSS